MRAAAACLTILFLAACGGGNGTGTSSSRPTSTAVSTTGATTSGCPQEPFSGTIARTVENDPGNGRIHVVASRSDAELVSAYSFDWKNGTNHTVYVGDYEIDPSGVGSETLEAPEGGMLATMFIEAEAGVAPGVSFDMSAVSIVDTGAGATVTGFGRGDVEGLMTILDVTDDRVCFEIDSNDPQQEIHGTVSAIIVNS